MDFAHPILNASGCWSANLSQIDNLYNSNLAGVVLKTCTLTPKSGNPPINYYDLGSIKFNCKGVPNDGYNFYKSIALHYTGKPIILSLLGNDLIALGKMLLDFENENSKKLVEINVSCPNGENRIPGYHYKDLKQTLDFVKSLSLKNVLVSLKLPPYFERAKMEKLGKLFLEYSDILHYIVVSNSIPNGYLFLNKRAVMSTEYAGISGGLNKWISLGNVKFFHNILCDRIKIIGCGGILTISDVEDYLIHGASLVQLGSGFYNAREDCLNIEKINEICEKFKK